MSRIIFTAGSSILSKAIRNRTGEPCSHVALECDGWVVHSNLLGVRVDRLEEFQKHCNILYSLPVSISTGTILCKYLTYRDSGYDFGALMYLLLRSVPCFGRLLPKKNLWKSSGMFLCTEWVTSVLTGRQDSMITPYQLYLEMSRQQEKSK
jgi:hypothetical protein